MKKQKKLTILSKVVLGLILSLFLLSLYACGGGRHVTCDAYGKVSTTPQTYSK